MAPNEGQPARPANRPLTVTTTVSGLRSNDVGFATVDWGDGTIDDPDVVSYASSSTSVTHNYTLSGYYVVVATAQSASGPALATTYATATEPAPTLTVTDNGGVNQGNTLTVNATFNDSSGDSTLPSSDQVLGWTINWGDGQTQTLGVGVSQTLTHVYAHGEDGYGVFYPISIAAQTTEGVVTSSDQAEVTGPSLPWSGGDDDTSPYLTSGGYLTNTAIPFTISACVLDIPAPTYSVDFGDGSSAQISATESDGVDAYYDFTHTYARPGIYYVDATGDDGSETAMFRTVRSPDPHMTTIPSQRVVTGDSVTVSATVTGLIPGDTYSAWINWADGQPAQVVSVNGSGPSATVTATLDAAPTGDFYPTLNLVDVDCGVSAGTSFALHANYLLDIGTNGNPATRDQNGQLGATIPVDNADLNGDGIPDFASGYEDQESTSYSGTDFVPMTIILPHGWDPSSTQFELSYDGSDPSGVTVTGSGTLTDPYVYQPASGALRVWDQPEDASRGESDYLAPGQLYDAADLSWSNGTATVYVEAITASQGIADRTIGIEMFGGGYDQEAATLNDQVKGTAFQTTVAVDANRDGTIELNGADLTSAADPYQFWLNDNTDVAIGEGADKQFMPTVGQTPDLTYGVIANESDLEDYAHLEVQVPMLATDGHGTLSPGWFALIQYVATSGSPSINLVALPATYSTSMLTYMNDPTAEAAMGGDPQTTTRGVEASGSADGQLRALPVVAGAESPGPDGGNGYLNYLFDGTGAGSGAVTVSWIYYGKVVARNNFNLQLQTITKMYEQVSAISAAAILPDGTANGLGDLRNSSTPAIPIFMPAPGDPGGTGNIMSVTNAYTSSSPQSDQMIVFVPGWRMTINEMESYADTALKRLYWQGYTGRFIVFDWPTEWEDTDGLVGKWNAVKDPQNFDESEQKAFNSAPGLYNLLVSLDEQYGYQNVDIFAHSMGNFVASEALRIAATQSNPVPVVDTYISAQSAVPAEAYDPATGGNSGDDWDNFFGNLGVAALNMYNFYNPNDYALTSTYIWPADNHFKPANGYIPFFDDGTLHYFAHGDSLSWANPLQRYELLSFAVKSASGAVGSTPNVGGPFNTAGQVDLSAAPYNFTDDHSSEFDGTEQSRSPYWRQYMKDFGLQYWSQ